MSRVNVFLAAATWAFLAIWILVCIVSDPEDRMMRRAKRWYGKDNAVQDRTETSQILAHIATLLEPIEDGPRALSEHGAAERHYWNRQLWSANKLNQITVVGAIAGVFGLVGVAASFYAAREAAHQSKRQADLAFAQLRPWITVTPTFDGDVVIGSDHTSFNIGFDLKNVGHAPAFDVDVVVDLKPYGFLQPPPTKEEASCLGNRKANWVEPGHWMPPDDPVGYPLHHQTWVVDNSFIQAASKDDELHRFRVLVTGCVTYRISGDADIHQTPFNYDAYIWLPKDPRAFYAFRYTPTIIVPRDSLRWREFPVKDSEPN